MKIFRKADSTSENQPKKASPLTKSEWLFGMAMLIFLCSFFLIAKKTSFRSLERLRQVTQLSQVPRISVEVSGNVRKPGQIDVPQGSTIRSVIRKARLKSMADLSNIDLDRTLETSCALHIPALEKIIANVQGSVDEKVSIELPAGSRICDLKRHLILSADADLSFFRSRKILKNNEIIQIPSKVENKKTNRSK